ncbi:MAG TPA: hypothetical protein PK691_05130 [Thermomicrobiales bacterium]|nr:hypothetical protein [Thermomicrobiales bacterium]
MSGSILAATGGGPEGYYAEFPNATATLTSAAFTVSASADILRFDIGHHSGSSAGTVQVALMTGGSYSTPNTLGTATCSSPCSWKVAQFDISAFRGVSVKIRFSRGAGGARPLVDRARTISAAPGWTWTGNPYITTISGKNWLSGTDSLTTPGFTLDSTAQYVSFEAYTDGASTPQREVYVLSGAGYGTSTKVGR